MNMLLFAIFAVNFAVLCVILSSIFVLYRVFKQIRAYVEPRGEGRPSPIAEVAQALADMVARSLVAQLKTTFMGKASGDARAAQAAMGDLIQDQANAQNPLVGGLLNSFPGVRKWLAKNPAALDLAMSKLSGLGGSGASQSAPSNGSASTPKWGFGK
jgi:hypothetical protein